MRSASQKKQQTLKGSTTTATTATTTTTTTTTMQIGWQFFLVFKIKYLGNWRHLGHKHAQGEGLSTLPMTFFSRLVRSSLNSTDKEVPSCTKRISKENDSAKTTKNNHRHDPILTKWFWWSAFIDIFLLASLCLHFPLNSQYISVSHLFGCYISCSLPPVSHPPAAGANPLRPRTVAWRRWTEVEISCRRAASIPTHGIDAYLRGFSFFYLAVFLKRL